MPTGGTSKFAPSPKFLERVKHLGKEKVVERVLKELEIVEYFHSKFPKGINDSLWEKLIRTKSPAERVSTLEYAALTQKRQELDEQKRLEAKAVYDASVAEQRSIYDAGGMGYGPGMYNLMLSPFRNQKHMNLLQGSKQLRNYFLQDMPKILLDCQFLNDPNMPAKNRSKLGSQLQYVINDNETVTRNPLPLDFINLDVSSPLMRSVMKTDLSYLTRQYTDQRIMPDVHKGNPYPRGDKEIYYVTRKAYRTFSGPLDPTRPIIIPVTMDTKHEAFHACLEYKYTPIYLPIREFVKWQTGMFVLALPNIIKCLRHVYLTGDWKSAVEASVPMRNKTTIDQRREKLGAIYDRKMAEKAERNEVIRIIEDTIGKEYDREEA